MIAQYSALYPARTRRTTLLLLALLIAAALAIGWATQAMGIEQTIAGSAGAASKIVRESALTSAPEELFRIAGSAGSSAKIARESA